MLHQRQRFSRDGEIGETRGKTRDPQNPHRVFDKRIADMAEQARLEIGAAVERIDHRTGQFAVGTHFARHRVDRQVAAREIFFERHVGRVEELEAVITGRRLALGARERVLLVRLRMQEHGKILARPADSPAPTICSGVAPTTT